ncbi:tyrosine-type recombinase/integrase [Thermoplasmatota archaeon]
MPKQKLTLSIDKEIITQAKNQNINLSSFLEIRLIDYLSDKEKCSRRDLNPSIRLERLPYNSSNIIAQPVLHMYMLKRRLEGISEKWAYDIGVALNKFLDYVEWKIDESKTLNYLKQLQNHYSVSSYRKRTLQIRRFLQYLGVNWANEISVPCEPLKLPKRITVEDVRKTIDYFNNHEYELQLKSVLFLGATSGMRAEEIYQLEKDDFNFSNNTVKIVNDPDNGRSVKTGQPRVAIFNSEARRTLVDYFSIFSEKTYYRLSHLFGQSHIEREFHKSPIRVKDLRKFFSQEWDRKGGPTSIKGMLMGHSGDVDSVHYNAQSEEDLKKIYDKVNIILGC